MVKLVTVLEKQSCTACNGKGKNSSQKCKACNGTGMIEVEILR